MARPDYSHQLYQEDRKANSRYVGLEVWHGSGVGNTDYYRGTPRR